MLVFRQNASRSFSCFICFKASFQNAFGDAGDGIVATDLTYGWKATQSDPLTKLHLKLCLPSIYAIDVKPSDCRGGHWRRMCQQISNVNAARSEYYSDRAEENRDARAFTDHFLPHRYFGLTAVIRLGIFRSGSFAIVFM